MVHYGRYERGLNGGKKAGGEGNRVYTAKCGGLAQDPRASMDRGLCGLRYGPSTSGLGVNTVAGDARPTQRCGQSG